VLAFALTARQDSPKTATAASPSAAVSVWAPPSPSDKTQAACVKVFAALPIQLAGLDARRTETDSSFVAAWGDPPIVLRCGVSKPSVFGTAQAAQLVDVNGVLWQPDPQRAQTVYTSIDRAVYVEVTVPAGQDQPLSALTPALTALPAVCTATDAAGQTKPGLPICK
jgi:hypothetical protein